MIPTSHFGFEDDRYRYETLLQMADLVVRPHDLADLLREVSERLGQAVSSQLITCALHDAARDTMTLRYWETGGVSMEPVCNELPTDDAPCGWVWQNQEPLVIHDLDTETRFARALPLLRRAGVTSYCCVPLTTAMKRLGALGIGSSQERLGKETDLRLLQRIGELVALAIENITTRETLRWEQERLQLLLEVNTALLSKLELPDLFPAISASVRKIVKQDHASVFLHDEPSQTLRRYAEDATVANQSDRIPPVLPLKGPGPGSAFLERETRLFDRTELDLLRSQAPGSFEGMHSLCSFPLVTRTGPVGTLNFASKTDSAFGPQDLNLLQQIAGQIAVALDNARAYREIASLKQRLLEEKSYLQGEIRSEQDFEEIIGESPALKRVLDQVKVAAPNDVTALLLGETGTGKELLARAVHRLSKRADAPFIKVNCAAIPTGLLESELFGHERGAFTGAVTQKVGRLELANNGTLFLDEVGDIPLEIQPKLLRVLQDQEFERLGSTRTIRVNIRLIAATNRDLGAAVAQKEFRSDLFYRLNVFPIRLPSLRERREDIPLLVRYFVQKFSRRMDRRIEAVPNNAMDAVCNWNWPGNIRELENFIERSVILTKGEVLNVPVAELIAEGARASQNQTLQNLEREYIIRVLRETGGVIAGPRGAAARLGLKRTTLQSRIQRMGISRAEIAS